MVSRLGLALLFAGSLAAHDPITTKLTWSKEISRFVQQHCASCHRPGGRAMSLLTYEEARPWAKAIKTAVISKKMPPWFADAHYGKFANDRTLSQGEKQ